MKTQSKGAWTANREAWGTGWAMSLHRMGSQVSHYLALHQLAVDSLPAYLPAVLEDRGPHVSTRGNTVAVLKQLRAQG